MEGNGAETLAELASGKGGVFSTLKKAKRAMLIVGKSALAREDGLAVLEAAIWLASRSKIICKLFLVIRYIFVFTPF